MQAFWDAVDSGDVATIVALLDRDESLSRMGEKVPPGDKVLHRAIRHGHLTVVEMLLAAGADPNKRNGRGRTPLDLCRCAIRNQKELWRMLLAAGADPELVKIYDSRPRESSTGP